MILDSMQIRHFQDDGFIIIPDLFDGAEVRLMQAELDRLLAEDRGRNVMPPSSGQVNYLITPLDDKSALFAKIPRQVRVVGIVEQLIGSPVLLWKDQIFLKPARVGAGNPWHFDNACFQAPDPTRGLGLWIALHDSSPDNGTLEVIPGSHRLPPDSFTPPGAYAPRPPDETVAVPMTASAGGAILFNFGVLHCTRDNPSDGPRAGLIYHFIHADNRPPDAAAQNRGKNQSL